MGICVVECMDEEKTIEIRFLYVLEKYRRQGIATGMFKFLSEWYGNGFVSCRLVMSRMKEHDVMHSLLMSLGFINEELNGTLYIVDKHNWSEKVMPTIRLFAGKTSMNYQCRKLSELSDNEWVQLKTAIMQPDVPIALRPDEYEGDEHVKIIFYTPDDKLVGWVVLTYYEGCEVTLSVIYILPEYRGGSLVFSLYETATLYVFEHWPKVDRLHFYLDTQDTALGNFYGRLLRNAQYECMKKYKYELSLLQTT